MGRRAERREEGREKENLLACVNMIMGLPERARKKNDRVLLAWMMGEWGLTDVDDAELG